MPELPEVETIVRDLDRVVRGQSIHEVVVLREDLIGDEDPGEFAAALRGQRIRTVTRRAKNIIFLLDADRLVVNLGMTGRMLVFTAGEPLPSHLGVRFLLDGRRELLYQDVRRFGRLWRIGDAEWQEWEAHLGVEPLSDDFTAALVLDLAQRSRSPIKTWLMDQRRIVGVGNIYASEALFYAGINPRLPAHALSEAQARRLHDAIRAVLTDAINFRGTTLLDYRDAQGERGGFAERLRVYGRDQQPCQSCGSDIERIVQAGRSTFFCPRCQQ
jgi:formamidopyrimidine-DNA glycosylase